MKDWHFFGTADKEANTLFPSDVILELSALLHPVYSVMFPLCDEQRVAW